MTTTPKTLDPQVMSAERGGLLPMPPPMTRMVLYQQAQREQQAKQHRRQDDESGESASEAAAAAAAVVLVALVVVVVVAGWKQVWYSRLVEEHQGQAAVAQTLPTGVGIVTILTTKASLR